MFFLFYFKVAIAQVNMINKIRGYAFHNIMYKEFEGSKR